MERKVWPYKFRLFVSIKEKIHGLRPPGHQGNHRKLQGLCDWKTPWAQVQSGKANRATCILGLIHSDISGPMHVTSMNGSRYLLNFIDYFSRYTWVFFLQKKSEVCEKFIELKALIENAFGLKIKILRYDNGGEYVSNEFLHICSQIGIQVQHSISYTPQQNSVAERKNWSLKEMTTCML